MSFTSTFKLRHKSTRDTRVEVKLQINKPSYLKFFIMKPSFLSSKFILTLVITTAFVAIIHPCCAKSALPANSGERQTRRCERALHQEALHFLFFHNPENRHKSVPTISAWLAPRPDSVVCMKSDRLSMALLKDFVARIKAKKITSSLLNKEVCEKVVNDLARFERRCLRRN